MSQQSYDLSLGDPVYSDDGTRIGSIRGFDESGCYVTLSGDVTAPTPGHLHTGGIAGEADLMWRCWECGEVGKIDSIPEACPSCGAEREDLYYWTED